VWGQLPYIAKLEKAGIPTVLIDFKDQDEMVKQEALAAGVPNIRFLPASRVA
jgi:ABC-type Fe3+-hydroxamate transport system substrate-binding protein